MTQESPAGDGRRRCRWCTAEPRYVDYHDREWGVPLKESRALFELLCLEGAQAGLSWWTILSKRENYRSAFHGFDPSRMAAMTGRDVDRLLRNPGIVRHKPKIEAMISNARAYLAIMAGDADFSRFLWSFAPSPPSKPAPSRTSSIESELMSKALKKAGFKFVGPTICYAFMQACGMVNDHERTCWRYQDPGAS